MRSLADDFLKQMNTFHSVREPFDTKLDIWLHKSYADILENGNKVDYSKVYFSPSSSSWCERALYHKLRKDKKDNQPAKPYHTRWQAMGTAAGTFLQRSILLSERHMKRLTGQEPRFKMAIIDNKYPAFEEFIAEQIPFEHNGQHFTMYGMGDGILIDQETGEKIIFEAKTKSEGPAKTNYRNMSGPTETHVDQLTCYSLMFETNTAIIAYLNLAKQKWMADEETLENNPDFRAFQVDITPSMQKAVLDKFARVTKAFREGNPPAVDLDKWLFNDYKEAISESITDEEITELEEYLERLSKSSLPAWRKESQRRALTDIKRRSGRL